MARKSKTSHSPVSGASGLVKKLVTVSDHLSGHAGDALVLVLRIWIAMVFWKSALVSVGDWTSTLGLFVTEFRVPYLSPSLSAYSSTAIEFLGGFMLVIGLGTRLATLPLLCLTGVIQFTYEHHHDHFLWALALILLLLHGPGRYSWDFFFRRSAMKDNIPAGDATIAVSGLVVAALSVFMVHESLAAAGMLHPWLDGVAKAWNALGTRPTL